MNFAAATAVRKNGEDYESEIVDGWDIGGNANGGYLMALAARAMAEASRPHPVAVNAHFLSPGRPGPVRINPVIAKEGKRFSTVRASLTAGDRTLVELLGSFSEPGKVEGATRVDAEPPELPPPDECIRAEPNAGAPSLMERFDLRIHPEDAQFFQGRPSGRPLFRGWFRFEDEPVDAFGLILAADAFPPTIFNANMPIGWAPTVEMTAHVRAIPVSGWLRCQFSTRFITGGMLEEDGEIWDESGRLVAQSRQLALAPLAEQSLA